jgi:hypothetical protein
MDADTQAAVKDAVIREAIGLSALVLIVFALGPGRVLVPAWIARARQLMSPRDPFEAQVRAFARDISRWDHEQAS